jgi:hypothetical protein
MATNFTQPRVYEDAEAERFASLWAGSDTGNTAEPEVAIKFRQLRRLASEKNLRIIDALELPEIRKAIDDQLHPTRVPCAGCVAAQAETQAAKTALAERERQTKQLIDHYDAELKKIRSATRQQTQYHRGVGEFLGYAWGFAQWRLALLLALMWARPWIMSQSFFVRHPWTSYACALLALWLLLQWAAAEIDETGWSLLLMKFGAVFWALQAARANPESAWTILAVVTAFADTRLVNNLSARLKRVPRIAKIVELFV